MSLRSNPGLKLANAFGVFRLGFRSRRFRFEDDEEVVIRRKQKNRAREKRAKQKLKRDAWRSRGSQSDVWLNEVWILRKCSAEEALPASSSYPLRTLRLEMIRHADDDYSLFEEKCPLEH